MFTTPSFLSEVSPQLPSFLSKYRVFLSTCDRFTRLKMILELTVFCALVALAQGFTCPVDSFGCIEGSYADPLSCSHYYQCVDDGMGGCQQFHRPCAPGTHFDPVSEMCLFEGLVNCDIDGETTTTTTTVSPTTATLPPITTTAPPPPEGSATMVAMRTELHGIRTPIPFDFVDDQGHWDRTTHEYTAPSIGFYFVSISGGALGFTGIDCAVERDQELLISLYRTSTSHNDVDTTSRDAILPLLSGQKISVHSLSAGLYSDYELQTSFSIFSLSDVMGTGLVAFRAALTEPIEGQFNPFPYNQVAVNEGGGYNSLAHTFTAPTSGTYYFSISVAAPAGAQINYNLHRNGNDFVDIYRTDTSTNNVDTLSRSVMVNLAAGEVMHVSAHNGSFWSNVEGQTSLAGFLYAPQHGQRVAWCVARTSLWTGDTGLFYPVSYDTVLLNEGNAWSQSTSQITISVSGFYYLHISSGAVPGYNVNYSVLRNDGILGDILRLSSTFNGFDTLGRSGMVSLQAGDVLKVGAPQGSAMYSDLEMQTSFTGFLLYPA